MRLFQGDFTQETVYGDDPLEMALQWQSQGATRLHVVDLDGAESGNPQNVEAIRRISETVLIPVEVGGGIRSLTTVEKLLKLGVDRVILGTAAVDNPEMVREACRNFRQAIIVSIDARDGCMTTHGWRQDTDLRAVDFARKMVAIGVRRFVYTDVSRDGTLTEPNFLSIFELINSTKFPVIASGGVTSAMHLKLLKRIGAEGAIVGKALYDGALSVTQAIQAAEDTVS